MFLELKSSEVLVTLIQQVCNGAPESLHSVKLPGSADGWSRAHI